MKTVESVDQDYDLGILMVQTQMILFKARQKELQQYNTAPRKALVLFYIQVIGDKATPAELARWLFLEPHTVSELLSRMEKEGLIKRVKDLEQKNRVRVVLTERGREAYCQSAKRESFHKIMSCLSEEEHRQLRLSLRKLRDGALKNIGRKIGFPFPPLR